MKPLLTRLLHGAMSVLHPLRAVIGRGKGARGVHSVALTPEGEIVLVRLSYARGWRLPGGGVEEGEADEGAALRELREEIGMSGFDGIERVPAGYRGGPLFVVRGVRFEPRWSLEVREVRAFAPDALPADTAPVARRMIAAAKAQ